MPDHADVLQSFIESTKRCCSFMSGLLCSLLSRHCTNLVSSPFGGSNKLVLERGPHSTVMDAREAIEITSSGSDSSSWDLEEYKEILDASSPLRDSASSANHRVLPKWDSVVGTASRGHAGVSQQVSSLKRSSATNGSSSNVNHRAESTPQAHASSSKYVGASNRHARAENSKCYKENVYEKLPSQQVLKRALPTSLQPFPPGSRSSNLVENISHSQVHDTLGKSHHYTGPSLPTRKVHKDPFGRSSDDDVIMHDNSGNRILPHSLMYGKYSNTPYVSHNDPIPRPGLGEERAVGSDERLIYQAALQDLNQPKVEANLPDGLLSVSLLRHQKIALAWMLQKEAASLHCLGGILADDQGLGKTISIIALIQTQISLQSKSKKEGDCIHKTEALNLDDDDDNSTIALDKGKQPAESDDVKLIPEVTNSNSEFRRRRPAAGTLVVCPATVLRQWSRELKDKVADEAQLSVLIYHGGNRTKDPLELAKYDVVLTTYAIVTNEVPKQPLVDEDDDEQKTGEKYGISLEFSNKKRKSTAYASKKRKKGKKGFHISAIDSDCGALARVGWFRVVLDEAQTIKNHRTLVARACCGLRAKRRWCLSGTPIQNAIDELYSYFRFLKYDPYAAYKSFCQQIKFPIARNSIHGYKKLQAVLRAIMLRRTKGTLIDGEPIISLPPKIIHLTKVDFSPEERAFYAKLESDSRSQFKAYAAAGTLNQNYANILLMLLRLRQACDHPLLVKGFNSDPVERDSLETAKRLPRDMLVNLLNVVDTSLAICQLCSDPPEDAVITMCGHVFCYQCVSECLTGDDNMCPAHKCKEQIGSNVVFSKATLRSCISEDPDSSALASSEFPEKSIVLKNEYSSSKIRAVIEILQSNSKSKRPISESHDLVKCNGDSLCSGVSPATIDSDSETEAPIKAIIFSQWTSMLDLVEASLNQYSLTYRRLDGTMTLAARDRAVKEFNTYPEVTVMLMSLKAGNLGLNMVAACHVILLDLWWNPTTEDQAIDRAHRIGQTRPVTVSRMTVKDTVEDRILALQEEKRKMVASAFGEDPSGGSTTRLTVEDLKYLFFA